MALINRMSRLLAADIHAVLDRIEEPEALLRQAIRDMEEEIERADRHCRGLEQEIEQTTRRRQKLVPAATELDARIGVCLDSNDETLARKLVRRKLQAERLDRHLEDRLEATREALAERRADLAEQCERLDVVRQQAELATETSGCSGSLPEQCCEPSIAVGEDEVEAALLVERQRRQRS